MDAKREGFIYPIMDIKNVFGESNKRNKIAVCCKSCYIANLIIKCINSFFGLEMLAIEPSEIHRYTDATDWSIYIPNKLGSVLTVPKQELINKGYKIIYPLIDNNILYGFSFNDIDYNKYIKIYDFLIDMINSDYDHNIIRLSNLESLEIIINTIKDLSKGFNDINIWSYVNPVNEELESNGYFDIYIDRIDESSSINDIHIRIIKNIENMSRDKYKIYKVII